VNGRREVVDAQGYLHAIAASRQLGTTHGYQCTCGAWRSRGEFDDHLQKIGTTVALALPIIDREMRARAQAAGQIAGHAHYRAVEDDDGCVRCPCGLPLPTWRDWAVHHATAVLTAALDEIST
jgi:hypothetical protein